jgi:hypothetical protein
MVALILALSFPVSASAGPLREAVEKAGRELALAQVQSSTQSRARFWTAIALIAGGGALAIWGGVELADSENGPDDDDDESGAEDSDNGEKVMLGSGMAAAGLGAFLLLTGRSGSSPALKTGGGRLTVAHSIRF